MKNTTTCFHCGEDYPDAEMLPLKDGGELCGDCMDRLRESAPDLLAALEFINSLAVPCRKCTHALCGAVRAARVAIAKARKG